MNDLKELYNEYLKINLSKISLKIESEFLGKLKHSKINYSIMNFIKNNCKSIEVKSNQLGKRQTIISTNIDVKKRHINLYFYDNHQDEGINLNNDTFMRLIQTNIG